MAVHSYSVSSLASLSLLDSLALSSAVNSLGWLSWEEGLSERELRACKRKKHDMKYTEWLLYLKSAIGSCQTDLMLL